MQDDDVEFVQVEVPALFHSTGVEDTHIVRGAGADRRNMIEHGIGVAGMIVADEQNRILLSPLRPRLIAGKNSTRTLWLTHDVHACRSIVVNDSRHDTADTEAAGKDYSSSGFTVARGRNSKTM